MVSGAFQGLSKEFKAWVSRAYHSWCFRDVPGHFLRLQGRSKNYPWVLEKVSGDFTRVTLAFRSVLKEFRVSSGGIRRSQVRSGVLHGVSGGFRGVPGVFQGVSGDRRGVPDVFRCFKGFRDVPGV